MTIAGIMFALALQMAAPAPFQTVAREMMSQVDVPRQVVVRTQDEWAALWKQHTVGDAPKVDFASRTVVAVFLGSRMSGGFSAEFVGTKEAAGVLTVQWREVRPERGMVAAQVLTSPMHAASIPRFAGDVRFEKVEK